jgi:tyrosinase
MTGSLLGKAFADYAVAPARRRAASTLAATDPIVVGYSRAVAAMKALPASNPCSWAGQAAIHSPGLGPAGPCDHGSMFWAWHRMYLYWFERIVRRKSGMYDWALPYWDYSWETVVSTPAQRQIPAPLRDTTSPLYDGTRNAGLNGGGSLTPATTATAAGFIPTNYFTAQSSFQGTPHNVVHTSVCGDMCAFATAGLDPLFWLHHCEIDRQWNLWLTKGGGRSSPLGDATWKNTKFTFYDECCEQVQLSGCDILRAALQLSYVYEVEPPQVNQYCLRIVWPFIRAELLQAVRLPRPLVLGKDTQTVQLVRRQDRKMVNLLTALAAAKEDVVLLQFKNVEADRQPGASWEVYVGLPPNAKPSAESPYFVGNVALFGDGVKGEGHHPAEFTFPLTGALRAAKDLSGLQVTIVSSSGVETNGRVLPAEIKAPVRVGEVNLLLDKASPQRPSSPQ